MAFVLGKPQKKRKASAIAIATGPEQDKSVSISSEEGAKKQQLSPKVQSEEKGSEKGSVKKSRYILYVTNIPYDAGKEDIEKHFGILKEKLVSIRMLTDKGTGQFRGTCFLECQDKESFSVALKLHHTKILGRKIVVEPTVGGGGKGQNRMRKLNEKKEKFSQVRKKRIQKDKMKRKKGNVQASSA